MVERVATDEDDVMAGVKQEASAAQAADSGSYNHHAHPRIMAATLGSAATRACNGPVGVLNDCVLVDVFPSGETRSRPRVRARRARPWDADRA